MQQPVLHDAGDPPGVGGGDDHQALPGLHRGGVSGLDAVVQAQQRLTQPVGDAPGRVAAVPGAGKVKNHIKIPSQWSISCWMISAVQPVKVFSRVWNFSFCHWTLTV